LDFRVFIHIITPFYHSLITIIIAVKQNQSLIVN